MKIVNAIVLTLVIIGGINWGLIGLFNYNLVEALFGTATWFTRIVYTVVGLAGIYAIAFYGRDKSRDL